jgi:hypothetical protein
MPGATPSPTPAAAALPATPAPEVPVSILWSPMRQLAWSDFQGPPEMSSPAAAVTAYAISYEAECGAGVLTSRIVTAFLPEKSWVKRSLLERPEAAAKSLRHEQTHFDLSEVQVRKARRALAELTNPCRGSQFEFDAFVQPYLTEDAAIQEQYDRETGNGVNQVRQAEWDALVRRQLADLRRYAR